MTPQEKFVLNPIARQDSKQECSEFLYIIKHFLPQDLTQVERIQIIEHLEDCDSCSGLVGEMIKNMGEIDQEAVNLALMDKKIWE